jgi:hypothetical protein
VGDKGVLTIDECWNYSAPVYLDKYSQLRFRAERYRITKAYPFLKTILSPHPREYPPLKKSNLMKRHAKNRQDFARGIADQARAITQQCPARLPADFCLHVNEAVLAIQNAAPAPYHVTTSFEPLQPMDDAALKEFTTKNW